MNNIDIKSMIIGLLFGLCLVIVAGQKKAEDLFKDAACFDKIIIKHMTVIDDDGNIIVSIGGNKNGGTIEVIDKKYNLGATMSINKHGGIIGINNKKNELSIMLSNMENYGGIAFYNEKNNLSNLITSDETGGMIRLYNKTNERVVDINSDEYGNGYIGVWNRKGEGTVIRPSP